MSEQNPEIVAALPEENESQENFGEMLAGFDKSHPRKSEEGGSRQIDATVVAVTAESVFFDIGYKTEGVLPVTAFEAGKVPVVGDRMLVSSKGRNEEGYYDLSKIRVAQPKDWGALEAAFESKTVIAGTVTAVVKGGLTVDVGVRAFMPASRSGVRDAAEMEKLVGQEIRCRITKLDTEDEDVVVDRRVVLEEEERGTKEQRYAELKEGDTVSGTVRSLMEYGAFVDLGGGMDGLLHIGEISWSRVNKPEDVLSLGQPVEVKIVKIDPATKRIGLSMKQLLPHPWDTVPEKYRVGERVRGAVSRVTDFGAFVELEPGVEGMIHVSEMSWAKKVRKPEDLVKVGDVVEAVILGISPAEKRMALGLKQTLGDPWAEAGVKFAAGSTVTGPVASMTKFGAFVQLTEGVEGMVHISEIVADRRLNHPTDVLRVGQVVQAKVLEFDQEKRQLKLSMKQLIPTGLDEFLAEHAVGDKVTGRLMEVAGETGRVELGEGVVAACRLTLAAAPVEEVKSAVALDLSSLSSMLNAKWKGGASTSAAKPEALKAGQVRSFKITNLDVEAKKIELELI